MSLEVCHQVCDLDSAMEFGLKQLIADVLIQVQTDCLPSTGSTARLIRDTHADTVVKSAEINVSQMFNFEDGHRCSPFPLNDDEHPAKGKVGGRWQMNAGPRMSCRTIVNGQPSSDSTELPRYPLQNANDSIVKISHAQK